MGKRFVLAMAAMLALSAGEVWAQSITGDITVNTTIDQANRAFSGNVRIIDSNSTGPITLTIDADAGLTGFSGSTLSVIGSTGNGAKIVNNGSLSILVGSTLEIEEHANAAVDNYGILFINGTMNIGAGSTVLNDGMIRFGSDCVINLDGTLTGSGALGIAASTAAVADAVSSVAGGADGQDIQFYLHVNHYIAQDGYDGDIYTGNGVAVLGDIDAKDGRILVGTKHAAAVDLADRNQSVSFHGSVHAGGGILIDFDLVPNVFFYGAVTNDIDVSGGYVVFRDGATMTGDLDATGGEVSFEDATMVGDLAAIGADVSFDGATAFTGAGNFQDGTFRVSGGTLMLGAGATLDLTSDCSVFIGNNSGVPSVIDFSGVTAPDSIKIDDTTSFDVTARSNGAHTIFANIADANIFSYMGFTFDDDLLNTFASNLSNVDEYGNTYGFFYDPVAGVLGVVVTLAGEVFERFEAAAAALGYGDLALGASDGFAELVMNAGLLDVADPVGQTTKDILDALGGAASGGYDFTGDPAGARSAYQGTSGKFLANTIYVSTDTVSGHVDLVNRNLGGLDAASAPGFGQAAVSSGDGYASYAVNRGDYVNRFWLGAFGAWMDADQYKNDAGYEYKSGGAVLGFDRTFGGAVTVGGSFAATFGSYEDKEVLSNDSDIDTYSFNLYAGFKTNNGFFARAVGGYAYSDDDINVLYTAADREKADYHVDTWSIGGAMGYEWRPLPCFTLAPSVGLYHYRSESNRFSSTTKNDMKLKYHRTEMPVELAAGYTAVDDGTSRLSFNAKLGWAYNLDNDRADGDFFFAGIDAPSVYVEGRRPGRHTFKAGAGLKYERDRFDFAVNYDYRHRAKMDAHSVTGTVGIRF